MPKVFISYSHDSQEHTQLVLQLANALRGQGVDVELDQYRIRPPQGWSAWCEEGLRPENSEFVLVICTDTYRKRVENRVSADEGRGVFWEGKLIYTYLYNDKENTRFIPVLPPGAKEADIPRPLRHDTRYHIKAFDLEDSGYLALYHELTGQPAVTKPGVGAVVSLPSDAQSAVSPLDALPARQVLSRFVPAELIGREAETKKRWLQRHPKTVWTVAGIIVLVIIIAAFVEIPNSLMNWVINIRTLSKESPPSPQDLREAVSDGIEAGKKRTWKPPEFNQGTTRVHVTFGGMSAEQSAERPDKWGVFAFGNEDAETPPFWLQIKDRRLWVEAVLTTDDKSGATFRIRSGKDNFFGDFPRTWDYNFNDRAMEIVGPDRHPIIQLVYVKPAHLDVKGVFPHGQIGNGRATAAWVAFGTTLRNMPIAKAMEAYRNEKPLFKYPESKYPGVLAE